MAMLSVVRYTPPSWARAAFRTVPSERVRLTSACAERPTPVFPMRNLPGLPEGVELFVKRDDYTGVELSGNKVRKLEFIFADALKMGADCVVTCGGAQSNHARATAIAARMLGLEPFLVLRLEEPHVSEATAEAIAADPPLVGNLLVDRLAGAQLRFVTKSEYSKHGSESLIQGLCNELQSQGRRPFAVPVGGSSGLGCWGYLEAVAEMRKQDVDESLGITDVAFACGSGGTAAGLALGNHLSGWGVGVHAYSVCDSPEYFHDFIDTWFRLRLFFYEKACSWGAPSFLYFRIRIPKHTQLQPSQMLFEVAKPKDHWKNQQYSQLGGHGWRHRN
ncbi:unnamed protein product [Polarella glacialis]|uniref:Tryptophan synthase beta chain-like PALP domain-containing protein n=1 Tax=Polarella glacialis TaxID=89957 RepID=A0A813F8P3_POLGL|nr:unnamed protein product [Polarella glacialis]CAE8709690.1 unnamed protein product [Polarella glacialis]